MQIEKIIDYIGYNGPIILFITSVVLLLSKKMIFVMYLTGYILNMGLNYLIKHLIQEPRPSKELHYFESDGSESNMNLKTLGAHEFGMPSGHAQNVGFSVAFVWMALHNMWITAAYTGLALNTMFQRVKYKNHTIMQVLVGGIVGSIFGYMCYKYR